MPVESPSATAATETPVRRLHRSLSHASLVGRKHVNAALASEKPARYFSSTRGFFSDIKVFQIGIVAIEALWTAVHLYPGSLPPAPAAAASWSSYVPELAKLASSSLWAPFGLWLLTSVVAPLVLAFVFNFGGAAKLDSVNFWISRGLIAYVVYGNEVSIGGLLSPSLIQQVNSAYPGKWIGMIIAALLGGFESVYYSISSKS